MAVETLILLVIIGFVLYKIYSSSSKSSKTHHKRGKHHYNRGSQRGKSVPISPNENIIKSAQRQVSRGNFDEAANLYLRAGQVFTAAKMKLFKGPSASRETLELIKINAPQRFDIILDNLVNEFYYRLKKPEISISLLRSAGYHERAEAIEVATGVSTPRVVETYETPHATAQTLKKQVVITQQEPIKEKFDLDTISPLSDNEIDDFLDNVDTESKIEAEKEVIPKAQIPNSLMMASADLSDKCLVCRKAIESGDTFIYCLNCGKPGHYKHLAEMMRVTGKCPSCKESLKISKYDL